MVLKREVMDGLLKRADDFFGYVAELTSWIAEKGKEFPYTENLLECGRGIGETIRDAEPIQPFPQEGFTKASGLTDEFCRLMGLLVKTGVLSEIQSKPLLSECLYIRKEIAELLEC